MKTITKKYIKNSKKIEGSYTEKSSILNGRMTPILDEMSLTSKTKEIIETMAIKYLEGASHKGFTPNPELSSEDKIKLKQWFKLKFKKSNLKISLNSHDLLKIIPDLLHILQYESKSTFTIRIAKHDLEMLDIEVNLVISKENVIKSHKIGTWHFEL